MKKTVAIDPLFPDPALLSKTAKIIQNGGLVAFPTDTCYGLAVNPFDPEAVARLFETKGRLSCKPIILLVSGREMLKDLIRNPTPIAKTLMAQFWPGPLTLIFEKSSRVPDQLSAADKTIGIRYPKAEVPIGLILKTGFPLTATSANRSGQPTAASAAEIETALGNALDLILDAGPCERLPSALVDTTVSPAKILRKGNISRGCSKFCVSKPKLIDSAF